MTQGALSLKYQSDLTSTSSKNNPESTRNWRPDETTPPLNQVITPPLDELLGVAVPIDELLARLEQQYRDDEKEAFWFLSLDEPISSHLDGLLMSPKGSAGKDYSSVSD